MEAIDPFIIPSVGWLVISGCGWMEKTHTVSTRDSEANDDKCARVHRRDSH